jgi:hypothetical protein
MELRSVKNWLYYQFSIPLLGHGPFNEGGWGHSVDNQVAAFLQQSGLPVEYLPFYVISAILCFAIAFWCLYPALRGGRHRIAFIGFLFMSVMSALCSYNMSVGFRYVYVSSVTLLIILIAELTGDHTPPARRLIIGIVLTVSLFSHARDYTVRPYGINYPIWYQQVYMWRVGAIDAPNIWPPGWTVQLTRDKR